MSGLGVADQAFFALQDRMLQQLADMLMRENAAIDALAQVNAVVIQWHLLCTNRLTFLYIHNSNKRWNICQTNYYHVNSAVLRQVDIDVVLTVAAGRNILHILFLFVQRCCNIFLGPCDRHLSYSKRRCGDCFMRKRRGTGKEGRE